MILSYSEAHLIDTGGINKYGVYTDLTGFTLTDYNISQNHASVCTFGKTNCYICFMNTFKIHRFFRLKINRFSKLRSKCYYMDFKNKKRDLFPEYTPLIVVCCLNILMEIFYAFSCSSM